MLSSPTCVGLRYGHLADSLEGFLGSVGWASLREKLPPHHLSGLNEGPDFPRPSPYGLEPPIPAGGWLALLRRPIAQTPARWYRNINLFSITYAFQPRLRDRLTLGGLTFPRNPWVSGDTVFHRVYRYLCRHAHFPSVHRSSRSGFAPTGTLPYRRSRPGSGPTRSFGAPLKTR